MAANPMVLINGLEVDEATVDALAGVHDIKWMDYVHTTRINKAFAKIEKVQDDVKQEMKDEFEELNNLVIFEINERANTLERKYTDAKEQLEDDHAERYRHYLAKRARDTRSTKKEMKKLEVQLKKALKNLSIQGNRMNKLEKWMKENLGYANAGKAEETIIDWSDLSMDVEDAVEFRGMEGLNLLWEGERPGGKGDGKKTPYADPRLDPSTWTPPH